jgi:hypothetical protein
VVMGRSNAIERDEHTENPVLRVLSLHLVPFSFFPSHLLSFFFLLSPSHQQMAKPLLSQLQSWALRATARQGWSDAEQARFAEQVARVHSDDQTAFVHLYGCSKAGKTMIACKLVNVATNHQSKLTLKLFAIDTWIEALFRHACRGRARGCARLDLSQDLVALWLNELRIDTPLTSEQYGAMMRGEPVQLTWAAARIPAYVCEALTDMANATVYDANEPGAIGPSFVRATFRFPRLVILSGNELPRMDTSHLPLAQATTLAAEPFVFSRSS